MSLESVLGPDVNIQAELEKAEATPAEQASEPSGAAVVVEERAPEIAAEASAEEKPAQPSEKSDRHVPLAAHLEERKKFQSREADLKSQLERRDSEYRESLRKLQERVAILSGEKQAPPTPPEFEADPAGHLKARQEAVERALAAREAQDREANAHRQVEHAIMRSEAEFAKEHADYESAAAHYRTVVFNNLRMFAQSDEQAGQQTVLAIKQAAAVALQQGKNPAEVFYTAAKNMGWQAKPAAAADAPRNDKGQFIKLEAIAKGQDEAKSLSGGGKAESTLTLDALAAMDPDDIARFTANDADWSKLKKLMP